MNRLLGRALRLVWMRRLDEPRAIEAVLRHPAFHDRAPLENALSRFFFRPFSHQEVVAGARFEARAEWSRGALGGMPPARVIAAGERAFAQRARAGVFSSLLDEVRRVVVSATVELALGDDALEPLVLAAVADFDRGIKMMGAADLSVRRRLAQALAERLADPSSWSGASYLTVARRQALALALEERVDHMAGVFLATGSIQVTDVVTHALVALAQHPAARAHSDAAVVRETLRHFPVNASLTRLATADARIDGRILRRGEAVTVVPARINRRTEFDPGRGDDGYTFSFGTGPRGCPARRVALALAETLLGCYRALGVQVEPGYRHRRSLAQPIRARLGAGAPPSPPRAVERAESWLRYAAVCAVSYPRAFVDALPELASVIVRRG